MLVATTLTPRADGGGVRLALHYIHDAVAGLCGAITGAPPALAAALHRVVLFRLRPLLCVLDGLREAQRDLERGTAAEARALGGRPRALLAVMHPLLYHDACTLYWGLLGGWARGDDDCSGTACVSPPGWPACACGARHWGLTCTPPRLRRGALVREALDECVAFCWTCTARRPVDDAVPPPPPAAATPAPARRAT